MRPALSIALASLATTIAWSPAFPQQAPPRPAVPALMPLPEGSGTTFQAAALAAGRGHVVAVRSTGTAAGGSRIDELGIGRPPRPIARTRERLSSVELGTDRAGRGVVVARGCVHARPAGEASGDADPDPRDLRCRIRGFDLQTGKPSVLTASGGGAVADLDRGVLVTATGLTVRVTPPGGRTQTLPPVPAADLDWAQPTITELDAQRGVIAAVAKFRTDTGGGSALLRYDPSAGWTRLSVQRYGEGGVGPRQFFAPTVADGDVLAFFDGAEDAPGFIGRWNAAGKRTVATNTRPFGEPVHVGSAAIDGGRLVASFDSGECFGSDCPARSYGPLPID